MALHLCLRLLEHVAETYAELVERIVAESVLVGYERPELFAFQHEVRFYDHRLVAVVNPARISLPGKRGGECLCVEFRLDAIERGVVLHGFLHLPAQEAAVDHKAQFLEKVVLEIDGFGYRHVEEVAGCIVVAGILFAVARCGDEGGAQCDVGPPAGTLLQQLYVGRDIQVAEFRPFVFCSSDCWCWSDSGVFL